MEKSVTTVVLVLPLQLGRSAHTGLRDLTGNLTLAEKSSKQLMSRQTLGAHLTCKLDT